MMQYGNTSGGAGNLWKLLGASPSDIDLNAANGANGILASAPGDPRLKLILSVNAVGEPVAALGLLDNAGNIWRVGAGDHTGSGFPIDASVGYSDAAGIVMKNVVVRDNMIFIESTDGTDTGFVVMTNTGLTVSLLDGTTTKGTTQAATTTTERADIVNGGASQMARVLSSAEFGIIASGTRLFYILSDGKIQTNQIQGAVAPGAPGARLPVYDTAGAFQGYIQVWK